MAPERTSPTEHSWSHKTGMLVVVAILSLSVISIGSYFTWNTYLSAEAKARKNAKAKKPTKPRWSELTSIQREALAPLAAEWDQISVAGKKKWLIMGDRIALMQPEEKQRAQERLRDWVKLTPEQRRIARANYAHAKKNLAPNEKFAQWQRYQQLTEEQKKELAAAGMPAKNQVVNPPAQSEKATRLARSVKSTPRPELEKPLQAPSPEPAPAAASSPAGPAKPPAPSEAAPV
jgi:hypothetical protein